MKKGIGTLMAVLFVAAVATSAFAFGGGRGPGYGPCGRGDFQMHWAASCAKREMGV